MPNRDRHAPGSAPGAIFWIRDPAGALAPLLEDSAAVEGWRLALGDAQPADALAGAILDEAALATLAEAPPCPTLLIGQAGAQAPDGTTVLPKPVRLGEVIAWMRRAAEAVPEPVLIGSWRLDPAARLLADGKAQLRLTEKEVGLLTLLLHHRQGASRELLLERVFLYAGTANTHTVETHIWRLRQKLDALPGAPSIVNGEGGYRLELRA